MPDAFRVLFLRLPQLDNSVRGAHEELNLAAACLWHALRRSSEGRHARLALLDRDQVGADDRCILDAIRAARPSLIAATVYVWNVERTLAILRAAKAEMHGLLVAVGGPEVARHHPFLFRSRVPDAVVEGEGEPVFARVLYALRSGGPPPFSNTALLRHGKYEWGTRLPTVWPIRQCLPPVASGEYGPNSAGVAYAEASRGCPYQCSFCRYYQMRSGLSVLPAFEVLRRVRALRDRGAREIRFIDPVLNSHPEFDAILTGLAAMNRNRHMSFFAEVRADRITKRQAQGLAAAGFREVEAGVQSLDPVVLGRIRRFSDPAAAGAGISRMLGRRIRVTVDIMYGLPGQTLSDARRSMRWAASLRGARVQCLQTLLLPGTKLRAARKRLGLRAMAEPPYAVLSTSAMTAADMRAVAETARRITGLETDCPTRVFVGRRLPDLFPERVRVALPDGRLPSAIPGHSDRRALMVGGADLFAQRSVLLRLLQAAIRAEPHILWQFVLEPEHEEPLDLLEMLAGAIGRARSHILDRWVRSDTGGRLAARRVFVLLKPRRIYDPAWVSAADSLLASLFY